MRPQATLDPRLTGNSVGCGRGGAASLHCMLQSDLEAGGKTIQQTARGRQLSTPSGMVGLERIELPLSGVSQNALPLSHNPTWMLRVHTRKCRDDETIGGVSAPIRPALRA